MTKTMAALAALALTALLLPTVQAHASPVVLDNEVQILADESSDAYLLYDGYDLQSLYLREGVQRSTGHGGLILRPMLYGGFGAVPVASALNLDLTVTAPSGTQTFRATTTDGTTWTGDLTVFESSLDPTELGVSQQGSVQFFLSYAQLGAQVGDSLTDITLASFADEDLLDISPGGSFVPGTGGAVAAGTEEGTRMVDSYTLTGPVGYTQSTITQDGETITIEVSNLITVVGQHLLLDLPTETPGWTVERVDANAREVDAGADTVFTLRAEEGTDAQMFTVHVGSDLGGYEALMVHPAGHLMDGGMAAMEPGHDAVDDHDDHEGEDATTSTEGASKDSPGVGFVAVLGLLGALAVTLRRRA